MALRSAVILSALLLAATPALARDYRAGEVWTYRTRPGEEASRVTIGKIETGRDGAPIYHISLTGLRLANSTAPRGLTSGVDHLPVARRTLDVSLIARVGRAAPTQNFAAGYDAWRTAYDAGKAGIFTIPVAKIADVLEQTLRSRRASDDASKEVPSPVRR